MDEELVIDFLQETIEKKLLGSNASRTFFTQTLLPGAADVTPEEAEQNLPPGM